MGKIPDKIYKITVLAVDDDPFILDTVVKNLTARGLKVLSTTDPETVIPLAAKEKPRLIISDIAMPGMDGLKLLKALKENPDTSDIPLILLTSSNSGDDVRRVSIPAPKPTWSNPSIGNSPGLKFKPS